jgi:hypothetical protein
MSSTLLTVHRAEEAAETLRLFADTYGLHASANAVILRAAATIVVECAVDRARLGLQAPR